MATQPTQEQVASQLAIPQHYLPPTARELRAQAVQRLQVGLFGLAGMLLLVALANIIMDRARMAEEAARGAPTVEAPGKETTKNDPLVDIGVVPSAASEPQPSADQTQQDGGTN